MDMGQLTKQIRDLDNNPLGTDNDNPIIDTCQYIVEFSNGDEAELAANVIASNMYAKFDTDGDQYVLLDSIIDFSYQQLLFDMQTRIGHKRGEHIINVQPPVGNFSDSGKTDHHPGLSFRISKISILLRLLSILSLRGLMVILPLTGGCHT